VQVKAKVCVIDDDETACHTTCSLLDASGEFECQGYTSPEKFLIEVETVNPACVVMDVRMPKLDGVQLQQQLQSRHLRFPIVVVTGFADVPTTVVVMKQGAETLIEKPFEPQDLIAKVREAVAKASRQSLHDEVARRAKLALEKLTPEEQEILQMLVTGAPNKVIILAAKPNT
jgi:two-component system, LuxR family, response regulator FixJ